MAEKEKDKQTHNSTKTTQHRKLKTKQHEPYQKLGVFSGAPEGSYIKYRRGKCMKRIKQKRHLHFHHVHYMQ